MPEGFKKPGSQKFKLVFFASIVLISLAILSFLGFFAWNLVLQENLNNLEHEIAQMPQMPVKASKIIQVKKLLDNHIYWSQVFSQIEKTTLPNIFFSSFSGDSSGQINLQGNVPNYSILAKQVKAFEQEFQQVDFSIQGLSKQGGLNIEIILNAVKLSKN